MNEWAIFNDEAEDYTAEQAVEAGFYSLAEAEAALRERYADDDACFVHECEAAEEPDEPEIDDGVKCCPDCERPNQFGETCLDCTRERGIHPDEIGLTPTPGPSRGA